jgi:hypothetical protein
MSPTQIAEAQQPAREWRKDNPMSGIHHVTAISGKAARNLHFYTHVIGL